MPDELLERIKREFPAADAEDIAAFVREEVERDRLRSDSVVEQIGKAVEKEREAAAQIAEQGGCTCPAKHNLNNRMRTSYRHHERNCLLAVAEAIRARGGKGL